jgi:hypothetical protein
VFFIHGGCPRTAPKRGASLRAVRLGLILTSGEPNLKLKQQNERRNKMLSGDFEQIKQKIKSKSWDELKVTLEEHFQPQYLIKSIMAMAPELFREKALFARPENDYRCIEEWYIPSIGVDDLIEKVKQNRRQFI